MRIVKGLLVFYLVALTVLTFIPLGGLNAVLDKISVLSLRGDHIVHVLVFLPLLPLWRMTWPGHPLWLTLAACLLIAVVAEGSHYYIPYRAWNINDLIANVLGVLTGGAAWGVYAFLRKRG